MTVSTEQFEGVRKDLQEATVSLTQTTTVLRQHVQEQRAMNARLEGLARDQEHRLRTLETWRSGIDAKLPTKLMAADEVEERLAGVVAEVHENNEVLGRIETNVNINKTKLAVWGGVVGALILLLELIGRFLF